MDALLRAVGTPRRREILRLLWDRERTAGEVHRALGDVTFGAVSQHLRILERAGALRQRRDGRRRLYVARREGVGPLAAWLEALWDDALYLLKLHAELEEARRGPRSWRRRPRSGKGARRGRRASRRRSRDRRPRGGSDARDGTGGTRREGERS
jgi:DNA-binding transcriptional ArsR family regulator